MPAVIGLDAGHATLAEAEHGLHRVVRELGLPAGVIGCTHLVHDPHPHAAISLSVPGPGPVDLPEAPDLAVHVIGDVAGGGRRGGPFAAGAARAARDHHGGRAGRAVLFPGSGAVTGVVTVGELLAASAVQRVVVLPDRREATPEQVYDTFGHVRPQWMDGLLTLVAVPAVGGGLAPFELPNPTPCCADHA
jgi:hypothetical protein